MAVLDEPDEVGVGRGTPLVVPAAVAATVAVADESAAMLAGGEVDATVAVAVGEAVLLVVPDGPLQAAKSAVPSITATTI